MRWQNCFPSFYLHVLSAVSDFWAILFFLLQPECWCFHFLNGHIWQCLPQDQAERGEKEESNGHLSTAEERFFPSLIALAAGCHCNICWQCHEKKWGRGRTLSLGVIALASWPQLAGFFRSFLSMFQIMLNSCPGILEGKIYIL